MSPKRPIVFIDTNILLDAYRSRNDVGLHLIKRLDEVQEHLVTTYQVEMEFKKNRQSAILESLSTLKPPDSGVSAPAFLAQARTVAMIGRNFADTKKRVKGLKDRIANILANPISHDPVYQVAQRLFNTESELRLARTDKRKYFIRRLAWKRFILGYPPRKKNDTSTGDGINWEWIIDCVARTNRDVILVSRDTDYGCTIDNVSVPNDWLTQELRERTKATRKLTLTPRLSVALDQLKIKVTEEEKEEETESIQARIQRMQTRLQQLGASDELIQRLSGRFRTIYPNLGAISESSGVTPEITDD
jgi:hypothetical protein